MNQHGQGKDVEERIENVEQELSSLKRRLSIVDSDNEESKRRDLYRIAGMNSELVSHGEQLALLLGFMRDGIQSGMDADKPVLGG